MMDGGEPETDFSEAAEPSGLSLEMISGDVRALNLEGGEQTEASHDGERSQTQASGTSRTAATERVGPIPRRFTAQFQVNDSALDMDMALEGASLQTSEDMEGAVHQLLECAQTNDHDQFRLLLLQQGGTALLHHAAMTRNLDLLKILLDDPEIEVNAQEGLGFTALILACQRGHTESVRLLLVKGADVLICTRGGFSCLHMAVSSSQTEIVNLLLHGHPPLPDLSSKRRRALIEKRTTVEKRSALHMAARGNGGHGQRAAIAESILRALRTSLLNVHSLDSLPEEAYGITDLMWVNFLLEMRNHIQLQEGKVSPQAILLNFAAYGRSEPGKSLREILNEKYGRIVQTYMELVLFSNSGDVTGSTVLHYAAWNGNVDLVRFLLWDSEGLQLGSVAGMNVTNFDGYKPLDLANKRGHNEVIQELLALQKVISFWQRWKTGQLEQDYNSGIQGLARENEGDTQPRDANDIPPERIL